MGYLSRLPKDKNIKDVPSPGTWNQDVDKVVVPLQLQVMNTVEQQLAWEDGNHESPSKLMVVMDAQLDKFGAREKTLEVSISDAVSDKLKDKRQGKDCGRVGKE